MEGYLFAALAVSLAGMVALPVFGLVIRFQPKFVHGLHADAHTAELNCYLAGACYAGTTLLCCLGPKLQSYRGSARRKGDALEVADQRNRRYKLPFADLESKDFVRAMNARDTPQSSSPSKSDAATASSSSVSTKYGST